MDSTASAFILSKKTNYVSLAHATIGAQSIRGISRVNKGTPIADTGWKLGLDLGIQLDYSDTAVIASSSWLDDYGAGESAEAAIQNLLVSIVDYRESLERRVAANAQLSEELSSTLQRLQLLLVR